jgi:hypothetical protein
MSIILSKDDAKEIAGFRHEMRALGQRGACYEVSQFIQWRWGFPSQDGIYQMVSGEPICQHRWNLLPDGNILDGTADQFCEGGDITIVAMSDPRAKRYRPIWTCSFNPDTITWHHGTPWMGIPDREWWRQNCELETHQGWWLEDRRQFYEWRYRMEALYESFKATPAPQTESRSEKL